MQDLERLLRDDDVEVRREALEGIKGKPHFSYIKLLLSAMGDPSWRVRNTATDILLEYPLDSYIDGLIQLLYCDDNAGARNAAIEALVRLNRKVTPFLIKAFKTHNRDVRKFIIDVLGGFSDERSSPLMLDALSDADENVRATAIEHIGKIKEASVVDALIRIIEADDIWTAYPAADALGRIGDKRAIPALLKALESKTLRIPALKSLSMIGEPETLKFVVPFIKDSSKTIQQEVLMSLERFYRRGVNEDFITDEIKKSVGDEIFDILTTHIWSKKPGVRMSAILMLGLLKDERAYNPLLEISQEENFEDDVKRAFVFIGRDRPESLLKLFKTDNVYQKRFICGVADIIGSLVYAPVFESLLYDEDGHTRALAAVALSKIGDLGSIEQIKKLLDDPYEDVQEAAVRALSRMGSWLSVHEFISLLRDGNPKIRKNAAAILGRIGAVEAIPALGFALKDEVVSVRKVCVEAFSMLKTEESIRFLILALTDEDPHIRASAALSLGQIKGEGVFEALSVLTSDIDDSVRVAVSKAFAMLQDPRTVKPLIASLSDKNGFVVATAIESLSKIGSSEARSALLKMLTNKDAEIVRTTIRALASFEDAEDEIVPFLKDSDWATRMAAVEVLGRRAKGYIRKELERLLDTEEDIIVKQTVMDVLRDTP
ncbi:MAG: HEAT repeat domain-containing protein [Nitrospirota bacterium]